MSSSELLHEARRALGIDQLILGVHDASFPSAPGEDTGRGSPYSSGARDLFAFASDLGFTGAQLGPQGETTLGNRSPYDGTSLAKSILSIDFPSLAIDPAWRGLVDPARIGDVIARRPGSDGVVQYAYAFHAFRSLVREVWDSFPRRATAAQRASFDAFRSENAEWLAHDEAYELATGCLELGDAFALGQMLVHAQHARMRAETAGRGWTTYGDLQVGLSSCDRWEREELFLKGYAMGAPPSRTDPEGQAWGYPVLDPRSDDSAFVRMRVVKMLREMDGIRIDHPHGLVCPWVYDTAHADPLHAVQTGARLFASPCLPDHPRLAGFAIPRADQIDDRERRYADGWVRELDDGQVTAYAKRFDCIIEAVRAQGRDLQGIMCEVLSTQPYPLRRVMERHGLGRFRVTQKANLLEPRDVYRSENAQPSDWIMVGNHDTPPLLLVIDRWRAQGLLAGRAAYLAARLSLDEVALAREPALLVEAIFADLFASAARNVMVFVPDLLGIRAVYNRPGVVDDLNWSWRVPNDFRGTYASNLARGEAMNVARSMAIALRAKSPRTRAQTGLIQALEAR
jgi:4-alpha-glucanotransferase